MSTRTAISWTDHTWNPWQGCTKLSPGCAHCYAEREHLKYRLPDFAVVRRSKTTFDAPLKWKEPARVFTCSWSDFFHEGADEWRADAWAIIKATPHLTYQILTKRPERIRRHLPADWGGGWLNVWLGVSVENQRWTSRILPLLRVPAVVHFLSCEPLLGPVDLSPFTCKEGYDGDAFVPGVDWVIVGGESGPDARPMAENWVREVRDQCAADEVAFWLKQDSGPRPGMQGKIPDDLWDYKEMPHATR